MYRAFCGKSQHVQCNAILMFVLYYLFIQQILQACIYSCLAVLPFLIERECSRFTHLLAFHPSAPSCTLSFSHVQGACASGDDGDREGIVNSRITFDPIHTCIYMHTSTHSHTLQTSTHTHTRLHIRKATPQHGFFNSINVHEQKKSSLHCVCIKETEESTRMPSIV